MDTCSTSPPSQPPAAEIIYSITSASDAIQRRLSDEYSLSPDRAYFCRATFWRWRKYMGWGGYRTLTQQAIDALAVFAYYAQHGESMSESKRQAVEHLRAS